MQAWAEASEDLAFGPPFIANLHPASALQFAQQTTTWSLIFPVV